MFQPTFCNLQANRDQLHYHVCPRERLSVPLIYLNCLTDFSETWYKQISNIVLYHHVVCSVGFSLHNLCISWRYLYSFYSACFGRCFWPSSENDTQSHSTFLLFTLHWAMFTFGGSTCGLFTV
jgi:hypothetical protein